MIKRLLLLLVLLGPGFSSAQNLIQVRPIDTVSAQLLNFIAQGRATYDVVTYSFQYSMPGLTGSGSTMASGAFSVPLPGSCDTLSLVNYCHGTVLNRDNVPSRNSTEANVGRLLASAGYACVMPDYLGLGDGPGQHPYLHAETEASASVYAMRAVRQYLRDSIAQLYQLNDEVLITGYSQGGHAAMATVKFIEENGLTGEFNLIAAAPTAGPHDLQGVQAEIFLRNQVYSNPSYVVYLLAGMNEVYGNLFNNWSEVLKSPYDTLVPPLLSGNFSLDSVDQVLPSRIDDYVEDTVLQAFRTDSVGRTHPLWRALAANSVNDWVPNTPMLLAYCQADEQVDYRNSTQTAASMRANGANVKSINRGAFSHGNCVLPALTAAADFMDSASTSCGRMALPISVLEHEKRQLSVYPNPARANFRVEGLMDNEEAHLRLFDATGRPVLEARLKAGDPISVEHLRGGIYSGIIEMKNGREVFRLSVRP